MQERQYGNNGVPKGADHAGFNYDGSRWTAGFYDQQGNPIVEICGAPFMRPRITAGSEDNLEGLAYVLDQKAKSIQKTAVGQSRGVLSDEKQEFAVLTRLAEVAIDLSSRVPSPIRHNGDRA